MKASHNYGALAVWAGGGPKHVQQVRYRVTEELVALRGGRGEGGKILKSNQGGQSQCRRGGQMEEQRKEMSKNLRKEMGSTGMAEVVSEVGERSARILNQVRCSCQGLGNQSKEAKDRHPLIDQQGQQAGHLLQAPAHS